MKLESYEIRSTKEYSQLANAIGIHNLSQLCEWLKNLPYNRTSNRSDISLVIKEKCGTCSSKHALIKSIAEENNFQDFKLIIGLYKMHNVNTPGIGDVLQHANLEFIPEAHCYIKFHEEIIDVTNESSFYHKIANEILNEIEILPIQVGPFKVDYHKKELENWINAENINYNLSEIWAFREQCIYNLSQI